MAGKFWREAASLMVISKSSRQTASQIINKCKINSDYDVIFLKRSSKSKFMPEAYVFPGGTTESSDFSTDWYGLFEKHGISSSSLKATFRFKDNIPEIYSDRGGDCTIPELGFRICALRETFEETGLLLRCTVESADYVHLCTSVPKNLGDWRKKIMSDSSQFLPMFESVGGLPWVWGLHEWSDWLTPAHFGGMKRRFDTIFYVAFVDNLPKLTTDQYEAESIDIEKPEIMLSKWQNEELWLAPPQVYELNRLLRLPKFTELKQFSIERMKELEQIFPVRIIAEDGWISVLPGDEMYPDHPDLHGEQDSPSIQMSMKDNRLTCKVLNRMEIEGFFKCDPLVNIVKKSHITPLSKLTNIKL